MYKYYNKRYKCHLTATSPYCTGSSPTLENATSGPILTTVYSTTSFRCAFGYTSSGTVDPFYNCLPNTTLAGMWSSASTYTCSRKPLFCIDLILPFDIIISSILILEMKWVLVLFFKSPEALPYLFI